jgi:hypothetical protein
MYIIGGVGVLVIAGIAYYCFNKGDKEEEGGDDVYASLI